jgi:hypothetical protein
MLYKITFPYEVELEVRVKDNIESALNFARVQCVKTKYCTYEFDSFAIATLRTLIELYGDCTIIIKKHGYIDKEYTCEDFIEYLKLLNGEEQ